MLSLLKKIKRIIVNIIFYYIAQQSLDRSKIIRKYNKYLIFYFKSEKIKNESKHYKVYENNIFKFLKFYKKTINLPQPFILKLNKGWILGKCDTPVFLDDSLNVILESVNSSIKYLYYSQSSKKIILRKIFVNRNYLNLNNVLNITGTMSDNKAHWLLEYLPRIQYFVENEILNQIKVLLSGRKIPFQIETLHLLGVKKENIIFWNGKDTKVKNFFVPSIRSFVDKEYNYDIYSKNSISWLRNTMLARIKHLPVCKYNKLYISRQKSKKRIIFNESELIGSLAELGFKTLNLEDLNEIEIFNYFRDAKIIIASHGAALSNMFCSHKAKIIELYPHKSSHLTDENANVFFQLSSMFELEHHVYLIESSDENLSFNIDIPKFIEFFTKIEC